MAYSPLNIAHADPVMTSFQESGLIRSPSTRPENTSHTPLSSTLGEATDAAAEGSADTQPEHTESKVSRFITSLTSSSRQTYELVEEDDCEVMEQITPTLERHLQPAMTTVTDDSTSQTTPTKKPQPAMTTVTDDSTSQTTPTKKPLRTASISRNLPLNHPIPDLQSLQGAYVKNVERLEESAKRMSMTSNVQGELDRIKYEQKQKERAVSASSYNPFIGSGMERRVSARSVTSSVMGVNPTRYSAGYSQAGYDGSPLGSFRSSQITSNRRQSRTSRVSSAFPEPEFEGRPLDSELTMPETQFMEQLDSRPVRPTPPSNDLEVERPTTSGSGNTYQQARSLFTDFDGVHFAAERNTRASRTISLTKPPRARDSHAFKEPQPGEEMVFYPAPVPVMLNLPVRLSKYNWSDQEEKRLQALSHIPDDMRKSALWLANDEGIPAQSKRQSVLPPQFRASAYFDYQGKRQDVQLKDGSAVATLDSILDAAAHAPVSAFTDHPFAGHLGNDFYSTEQSSRKNVQASKPKKDQRKSSLSALLKSRRSSGGTEEAVVRESRVPSFLAPKRSSQDDRNGTWEDERVPLITPDDDELPGDGKETKSEGNQSDEGPEIQEAEFLPGFSAAPTTLLAELQMRKAQQKSRNRTAIDAFPNGMHSTLLELDTVTQLQQKSRRQKHVKLAWEDEDEVDKENYDDDDVPLGILFPEKEQQSRVSFNRPMGLMEKKELEENEPLSHRRARLRGEPIQIPVPTPSPGFSQQGDEPTKPMLELPNLAGSEEEADAGETLAQRKKRIEERRQNGLSGEFARQVTTELGLNVKEDEPHSSACKTPEIEETLGQRRKRLQAEVAKADRTLKPKRSLADILQAHPVGYVDANAGKTALLAMQTQERAREREARFIASQEAERHQAYKLSNDFGNGHQGGLIQSPLNGFQGYQHPQARYSASSMHAAYGAGVDNPGTGYTVGMQPVRMNPAMSMTNMRQTYPHQYPAAPGYGYPSALDLTGMGPPLDKRQRARIEGWRRGIM